ncbi:MULTISPECIES: PA0069 family radical SAM protein [unclassified Methylophaga]|uniref:PA0069 family radical SAM protein n=1 Tax=unclassified Methylophaga TaxID=2629249 RepID=UPI000C945E53|nr:MULTISPECIES: PA0069 family radical SAM protein [unclassified Methylophaga]MAK65995.1 radical SAM protein [Methylophaga sp.]MAY18628.1 radical SAM protein [Methylophaga sp.]MBN46394.1 radical SAM protein [Methylophaga sp.]
MAGESPIKGRGTATQIDGRYNTFQRENVEDGWFQEPDNPPKTTVQIETPKTIITRNQSPDLPFSQSINPYRGCEHGCIYCYARPSHAYLGLSPGLDFETRLTAKPDAAKLLKKELAAKNYQCSPISLGANTDPYQPIERDYQITRQILQVLNETRHPCHIVTKSAMVERDIDILQQMASQDLVRVHLSITTLDPALSRVMEPRASAPKRRLQTIQTLRAAGIPVTVLIAPVIPVLTDAELEDIVKAVTRAGALDVNYILLRLPLEVSPLFEKWLQTYRPNQAQHILNRIHDLRGGKNNDPRFSHRLRGEGIFADLLEQRFRNIHKRTQLECSITPLRCDLFQAPGSQMRLF